MPACVEWMRRVTKLYPAIVYAPIDETVDFERFMTLSTYVAEDGGPPSAHASGYGIYENRPSIEHVFTRDYPTIGIRRGDRVRFWRDR